MIVVYKRENVCPSSGPGSVWASFHLLIDWKIF